MKKTYITIILTSCIIAVDLILGIPRLSQFSAVDEPYWTYDRTPQFWKAIENKEWKKTKINDKPGITVAILSGAGLIFSDPISYGTYRQKPKTADVLSGIQGVNFSLRLPIFLFALCSLPIFYLFIKKLLNRQIAMFSLIFIGLSPIILGISLIINPDSLIWIFMPLSMLGYFIFLKNKEKKYILFSGLFLGLALLTKYIANVLIIYYFIIIFLEYIFLRDRKISISEYFKKNFLAYGALIFVSIAVFAVLFPATWRKPIMILEGTLLSKAFKTTWPIFLGLLILILAENLLNAGRITRLVMEKISAKKEWLVKISSSIFLIICIFVLANTYGGMKIYNFESILASPKAGVDMAANLRGFGSNFFADFYALLFGLIPAVFLFFLFAIINIFNKDNWTKDQAKITLYFLFFIIVYYGASSVNGIGATVRYQIVLYPLASIIAAIGLYQFINIERIKKYLPFELVCLFIMALSFFSLLSVKPFYFAYASDLLPKKYILNLKGMGDGSYEAGQLLNSFPDAENLTIWSDKGAVCESFIGKCVIGFDKKDFLANKFDYFVPSTDRRSRSLKMFGPVSNFVDFKEVYATDKYVKKITIGQRPENFVKIIKTESLESQKIKN